MACNLNEEKNCVIENITHLLGGGVREVELPEATWCALFHLAVEEYVDYIQNWLIENQWSSVVFKDVSTTDFCFALTTRSLDYQHQFSYAYSKQVGLQSRGPWELKKDFVELKNGQQAYSIPAGREINEVLWMTPSSIDHATFASMGASNYQFGFSGLGDVSFASGGFGSNSGAYYIAPAYDVLLRAADYNLKNRLLRSDMIYKITAGPDGTRILHLMSTPNSDLGIINNVGGRTIISPKFLGCKVWYHYYDIDGMTDEEAAQCLDECKDIIKYPSDVPLSKIDFCDLNNPSQIWVRKYLTALAKETLGRIYGKYSGKVDIPNSEVQLDYSSYQNEAKEEKRELREELKDRLDKLGSDKQLERKANEAENLINLQSKIPMPIFAI